MSTFRRQATCYSVISSIVCIGWVPVHRVRTGRTKLPDGSRTPTRGGPVASRYCGRSGVDSVFILEPDSNSVIQFRALRAGQLQFHLPHSMPQFHRQMPHDGDNGNLLLFRIALHQL